MAWSLAYAVLGAYWAVSGHGFPHAPELVSGVTGPVAGRFGPGVAWIVVIGAGIPAAAAGTAMLRGVRVLRPLLMTAAHQLLCLVGGFVWLAATVSYARRSEDACLYCGRRHDPKGWNSRKNAARWGEMFPRWMIGLDGRRVPIARAVVPASEDDGSR